MKTNNSCFNYENNGSDFHGYIICDSCKSKLRLFTDKKIKQYVAQYDIEKDKSFKEEMQYRIDFIEKDYIKKR